MDTVPNTSNGGLAEFRASLSAQIATFEKSAVDSLGGGLEGTTFDDAVAGGGPLGGGLAGAAANEKGGWEMHFELIPRCSRHSLVYFWAVATTTVDRC